MADLWHSWGTSPKQKAREKEYNAEYYRKNRKRILLARKRHISGTSTVNKRPLNESSSSTSVQTDPETGLVLYNSPNANHYQQSWNEIHSETPPSPSQPTNASDLPMHEVSQQLHIKEVKGAVDDLVHDLGNVLLKSNTFTSATALGITLCRKVLKDFKFW